MKDYFEIKSAKRFSLNQTPTKLIPKYHSDHDYKSSLAHYRARLEESQTILYSNHARAMLIIFQGMDTAGKDGAIKHVMSGVNPQGCSVISFKTPTSTDLDHDYLWRINRVLPDRGIIGIFNRSYYEEVLVTRVHPEILKKEKLPTGDKHGRKFWELRYQDILNYESYLDRQGYDIVKIFIHISKEEQKRRLLERFADPHKLWKISEGDVHERGFWKEYQDAYGKCIRHTSSEINPWYIVPGDDKENARLSIAKILVDRFSKMRLQYPKLTHEEKKKLKKLRSTLEKD